MRFITAALVLLIASPSPAAEMKRTYGKGPPDILVHLERLQRAYPGTIASYDAQRVTLADGTSLPVSDGRSDKTFDEFLNAPDIDDMFAQAYPKGAPAAAPPVNFDPGRVRVEKLFTALYGSCRSKGVTMRNVAWLPKHKGGTVRL